MKHNTRETEEVWKSLEEKERAEEESEGGERDEEEGRDDRDGGGGVRWMEGWGRLLAGRAALRLIKVRAVAETR